MKNMMEMYWKALEIVEHDCSICTGTITKVELNYRAKNRFGQCKRKSDGTYELNFNYRIFDDNANEHAIITCMIHEILHTCKGGMTHKGEWKRLANVVREKTGYNVTRCNSYSDFGVESPIKRKAHNYVFVCEDCGQVFIRERASKFTRNYHNYSCGKCGGNLRFDSKNSNYQILTANPRYSYVENR